LNEKIAAIRKLDSKEADKLENLKKIRLKLFEDTLKRISTG
jgi:hypothetical protein